MKAPFTPDNVPMTLKHIGTLNRSAKLIAKMTGRTYFTDYELAKIKSVFRADMTAENIFEEYMKYES